MVFCVVRCCAMRQLKLRTGYRINDRQNVNITRRLKTVRQNVLCENSPYSHVRAMQGNAGKCRKTRLHSVISTTPEY